MEVLAKQEQLSEAIKNTLRNFKKDNSERKTPELIQKRINKLDLYWREYHENHNKLCQVLREDHDYFTSDEYNIILRCYQETKQYLQGYLLDLQGKGSSKEKENKQEESTASFSWHEEESEGEKKSRGTYSQLDDLMKKQTTNFKAFSRTVSQINIELITEKWEFEDTLRSLHSRWQAIDSLHWEIDSILNGSDMSYEMSFTQHETKYNNIKRAINNKLWSVSHREKSTPQLDIPIFTGNYQQWSSFKDLFCETIHNNPALSSAQKMQHLKSKLRGEAERLIQHLQIGSENYTASWDILNHRYNNKKLIFTSHMNILMSMPIMQQATSNQVKRIHDVTTECLNAIKNLGIKIDSWDPMIIHILSQKLDAETHSEYMTSLKDPRELPKMVDFMAFLENKFTTMESSRRKQESHQRSTFHAPSPSGKQEYSHQTRKHLNSSTNKAIFSRPQSSNYKLNCAICDSNEHRIYFCQRFLDMTPMQKRQAITRLNYCVNCLCSHYGKNCTSNKRCRECDGNHNTLLHDTFTKHPQQTRNGNQGSSLKPGNTFTAQQWESNEVLLATALIQVAGVDGVSRKMRALVDPGSQISIITENAAQQLRLPRQKCSGIITGVGTKDTNCKGKLTMHCSSLAGNFSFTTEALIMKKLTNNLPNFTFKKPDWTYLNELPLADPEFYVSRPIDILLGADVYARIIMNEIREANHTRPSAQKTLLGWILYGKPTTLQCNIVLNNIEDIRRFWETEEILNDSYQTADDQDCIKFYKETTTRKEDGKYQVRLPLKKEIDEIGQSRNKAYAQFLQLERKFKMNPRIADEYKAFMEEYMELGHMRNKTGKTESGYLMPHHCVTRESSTTALRVVFNASQNTSNGKSLNDYMHKGPNLQQDLLVLILKWRQYSIAFTADIEKMFRQIWVHPDDLKYQKILWRDGCNKDIEEFELTTVTYGTKAAPFLAMMTLRQLAEDERKTFPEAAKVVESSMYMDDLLQGSHTLEAALKMKEELIALLKRGGFNLRKWNSNHPELRQDQNHNKQKEYDFKHASSTKTLGLRWNPEQDVFIFESMIDNPTDNINNTKRMLLSDLSKLFDPLGWLTPISTKSKLLFQQVWAEDIPWDAKIPDHINKEWITLKQDLKNIDKIKLPRWLGITQDTDIELHGFCDASQQAYACVIYCKLPNDTNSNIALVVAKSKLVPRTKEVSLPRKELLGAHLLSQLMKKVEQCFPEHKIKIYGWTDSTAVLGWIQGSPDRWKTFVSNRVTKITEALPAKNWRYVKSADNPADCASRGITPTQLLQHKLWWQGPAWLSSFKDEKTEQEVYLTNEEARQKKQVNLATQSTKSENIISNLLEKYSSLSRAIRVLGWVRRFTSRGNRMFKSNYLTLSELKEAKIRIIKQIQSEEYQEEIGSLNINKQISSKSKILSLNPYLDPEGLLRVGGRLQNAYISPEMMHPIILPYDNRLTQLIIDEAHKLTYHGGARVTLAFIRQKYWIICGNRATKKYIRKCVVCKKQKPIKQEQIMGQLPGARVNQSRPFLHTGVDFTGHVFVKANKGRGIKTLKAYIAVFVCMVTKAVHLELVSDLTTSSFLAALRRMAARRGKPRHMYSDNGRNFVGASKVLQQEYQDIQKCFTDEFMKEITDMEITWHFNAPAWPSAGGIFEAAVKSFKFHLKRVIGQQTLTFEEFSTLLAQIEGCLNSRPLCALSEDPEDLDFLTPSHFLTGGPLLTIVETERDTRTRWQLTQKILQDVWTRWRSEYLTQLTTRNKWTKSHQNVNIDAVVIVHDENLPPGKWIMGRVVETHPGKDGYVRVVTLKTKSGYIKRPVTKISILTEHQEFDPNKLTRATNHVNNQTTNNNIEQNNTSTRRRTGQKSTWTTLFTTFMLFMTFISSSYGMENITKFKENQGLYFDKLSNMQLIKDEWKIITYYDMKPYWQGIQALEKYIKTLEKSCDIITTEKVQCSAITTQLRHQYMELEHYNQLLLSQQIQARGKHARRTRRGFVNAIGYLAGDLFGVLDERFAQQYKQDIALLRDNQKHLLNLWKNQTSIVEAENNLLKRTEALMNQQHKIANQHIITLEKAMDGLKNAAQVNLVLNDFSLESIIASNMLNSLRAVQDTLLQTVTEIHQGYFNIHIITPSQLTKELSTVSSQLPQDVSLPVTNIHSDLRKMYDFLSIRTRVIEEYFIFEIKIPLISRDTFEILRVVPLPKYQDEKMISIVPVADYVSVNMKKDLFIPMSETDIQTCFRQLDTYFCRNQGPEYQMKTDKNLCRLTESECMIEAKSCQDNWRKSSFINTYIYFCCRSCQVRVMCDDQITTRQLSGNGLITIGHGCIIKTDKFTIYPHRYHTSEIRVSPDLYVPTLAPINSIINLTIPHVIKDKERNTTFQMETTDIENKIKAIKTDEEELETATEAVSFHDIHHYVMIYIVLAVVTIAGITWITRKFQLRRKASVLSKEPAPQSAVVEPPIEMQHRPATGDLHATSVDEPQRVDRNTSPLPNRNFTKRLHTIVT